MIEDSAITLEGELRWREAELASLKLLVSDSVAGTVRHETLLRALWTLLYAHYEGFCKFAWDLYCENLQQLGIKREACSAAIARFSLAKKFKGLRKDISDAVLWSLCVRDYSDWMKENAEFDFRLETKSNLWPDLFRSNCKEIDLPHAEVDRYELKLRVLVSRRNEIAHGKKMVIPSLSEYQPYEDAVKLVMHELAIAVMESLADKTYLK